MLEEETILGYKPQHFYPVQLGQVFDDRYQTTAKLGFGSCSTIWLARDLIDHRYVALKIYIHNSARHRERPFYEHLDKFKNSQHRGLEHVRKMLSCFEVVGPQGTHIGLVLQISQMSLYDMDTVFMQGRGFEEDFVKEAITELLEALDFLHTEVQAVHTDVHAGNLLRGAVDESVFQKIADFEFSEPVARKQTDDRFIYSSRLMRPQAGPLLLSDFGEARFGPGPHSGPIMPMQYRAPEVLMRIRWSYAVDIRGVGLTAWNLLHGDALFSATKDDGFSDEAHFAELIAALGPPPSALLDRHRDRASEYWDEDGNWGEVVPIPKGRTLEALETKLDDSSSFLRFIRRALAWNPEDRPTASQLLQDPWLTK